MNNILILQIVLYSLALVALLVTLAGLAIGRTMLWRTALVATVCIGSLAALYPIERKLKPGLDLAGGTVLVYEVEIPEGSDTRTAIEQTIAVLRERVDPLEQKSLVWRRVGSSRIEIQMPAPSKVTTQRRADFIQQRDALLKDNLERAALNEVLRLTGSARNQRIETLSVGHPQRRELLAEMVAAQETLAQVRAPYETAQQKLNEAEATLAGATEAQKPVLQARVDELIAVLEPKALAWLSARERFNDAQAKLLSTNIDPAELDRILALTTRATVPGSQGARSTIANPRLEALEKFITTHTDKTSELRQLGDTFALYEEVKGPLDDPNDLIALLRGSGVLEFRIAPAPGSVPDVEAYREQLQTKGPRAGGDRPFRWFAIDNPDSFAEGDNPAQTQANLRMLVENASEYLAARRNLIGEAYGGEYYLLLFNTDDASLTKAKPDWELNRVGRAQDESGFPCVAFNLNAIGGSYMSQLTGSHLKQPMAIVLDGRIISAPTIQSRIAGSGIITGGRGGFAERELDYMIRTLSAGSLQARLSDAPILIQQIGGSFGEDNLRSGLRAAYWSLGLVALFMLMYYFFWGAVANFAVIANLLIVLGVMAALDAVFTLPGIAGLVLTIGMAVDANVLIYERIREELERKADIHTAVRQGFNRAFSSIFDANITTLITCLILGYTATADLKGFAVTLGIGVAANLFTGVFCTRVVIELWLAIAKPKNLPMLPMVLPGLRRFLTPSIDWVSLKWKFIAVSMLMIIAGWYAVFALGKDILDIEFRGGTQVSFKLDDNKMMMVEEVRQRLTQVAVQTNTPELSGDRAVVVTVGEREGTSANAFSIATLLQDPKVVSERIKEAFRDVVSSPEPIDFAGMGAREGDAPTVRLSPVFPIRHASLGKDINRAELSPDISPAFDVSDYLGGSVVVIGQMNPQATVEDVTSRIARMRSQPNYEKLGFRQFEVIGLDPAGQNDPRTGKPMYKSVAVVSRDNSTSYIENPDTFGEEGGLAATEWAIVRDAMLRDTSLGSITNFSSQVSATMKQQAIAAVVLSWIAIAIYVWVRFGNLRYGFGAIAALVHDVLIAVGLAALATFVVGWVPDTATWLGLEPFHLNLSMVAAVLTLIGYSVNDTIVTFDRIRENRGRLSWATPQIINNSINQTLSRTLLTGGTVFISTLLLYAIGGPGVHNFAFVMMVGTVVGTYSSIVIAAPILLIGAWGNIAREQTEAAEDTKI